VDNSDLERETVSDEWNIFLGVFLAFENVVGACGRMLWNVWRQQEKCSAPTRLPRPVEIADPNCAAHAK